MDNRPTSVGSLSFAPLFVRWCKVRAFSVTAKEKSEKFRLYAENCTEK
nr:MAG TPA: hypothetical protein [Caudoviricetes sp.]